MNPPIHPSQFDPLIDAPCTHLSGGHGRYKPPSSSPSLINKQFGTSVATGICFFPSPPVILRGAFAWKRSKVRGGMYGF